jgi:hypothetical protein
MQLPTAAASSCAGLGPLPAPSGGEQYGDPAGEVDGEAKILFLLQFYRDCVRHVQVSRGRAMRRGGGR